MEILLCVCLLCCQLLVLFLILILVFLVGFLLRLGVGFLYYSFSWLLWVFSTCSSQSTSSEPVLMVNWISNVSVHFSAFCFSVCVICLGPCVEEIMICLYLSSFFGLYRSWYLFLSVGFSNSVSHRWFRSSSFLIWFHLFFSSLLFYLVCLMFVCFSKCLLS